MGVDVIIGEISVHLAIEGRVILGVILAAWLGGGSAFALWMWRR